jgi:hypothetical protein
VPLIGHVMPLTERSTLTAAFVSTTKGFAIGFRQEIPPVFEVPKTVPDTQEADPTSAFSIDQSRR